MAGTAHPSPWYDRLPVGRVLVVLVLVAVATTYLLYETGVLAERWTGLGIGVAVAGLAAGFAAISLVDASRGAAGIVGVVILSVAVFLLAVIPIWNTVDPGPPLARGSLSAIGDQLPLGDEVEGPIRVWVRGAIGGSGNSKVRFELDLGGELAEGSLSRATRTARVARRGRITTVQEHNSVLIDATLGADWALEYLAQDENERVRVAVIEAAKRRYRENPRGYGELLSRATADPDRRVRKAARRAVIGLRRES